MIYQKSLPSGQNENRDTGASDEVTISWWRPGEKPPVAAYPELGLDEPSDNIEIIIYLYI